MRQIQLAFANSRQFMKISHSLSFITHRAQISFCCFPSHKSHAIEFFVHSFLRLIHMSSSKKRSRSVSKASSKGRTPPFSWTSRLTNSLAEDISQMESTLQGSAFSSKGPSRDLVSSMRSLNNTLSILRDYPWKVT